jgi:hypothetical protein
MISVGWIMELMGMCFLIDTEYYSKAISLDRRAETWDTERVQSAEFIKERNNVFG